MVKYVILILFWNRHGVLAGRFVRSPEAQPRPPRSMLTAPTLQRQATPTPQPRLLTAQQQQQLLLQRHHQLQQQRQALLQQQQDLQMFQVQLLKININKLFSKYMN